MKLFRLNWWPKSVRPDSSDDEFWDSMIYPEDLNIMETGVFNGNIFNLVGENEDYIQITDGTNYIRINRSKKEECLASVSFEGFFFGDWVQVKSLKGKNTVRQGEIYYMFYHHKDERIVYHIRSNDGKKIKKQYYSKDLQKKNQQT